MSKRKPTDTRSRPKPYADVGYFAWSRDLSVGLFVVLPLWLLYVLLRYFFAPEEINGAEYVVERMLDRLGPVFRTLFQVGVGVAVLAAAVSIHRRQIPWLRVGLVIVLEGMVYGLILGPVAVVLTEHSLPVAAKLADSGRLIANLIGAFGAGIFEELVFRLLLLSLLALLFGRACDSFELSRFLGYGLAILVSAVAFSWFHYIGDPNALEPRVFTFRAAAGVLLGLLFVLRGIGVSIYTHTMYDVFFYLNAS